MDGGGAMFLGYQPNIYRNWQNVWTEQRWNCAMTQIHTKKAKYKKLLQGHLFFYCWNLSSLLLSKFEVWGKGRRSSNKWHFFGSWCQKWQETQIAGKLNWFPLVELLLHSRNFLLVILFLTKEEWRWGSFFYFSNSLILRIPLLDSFEKDRACLLSCLHNVYEGGEGGGGRTSIVASFLGDPGENAQWLFKAPPSRIDFSLKAWRKLEEKVWLSTHNFPLCCTHICRTGKSHVLKGSFCRQTLLEKDDIIEVQKIKLFFCQDSFLKPKSFYYKRSKPEMNGYEQKSSHL